MHGNTSKFVAKGLSLIPKKHATGSRWWA